MLGLASRALEVAEHGLRQRRVEVVGDAHALAIGSKRPRDALLVFALTQRYLLRAVASRGL